MSREVATPARTGDVPLGTCATTLPAFAFLALKRQWKKGRRGRMVLIKHQGTVVGCVREDYPLECRDCVIKMVCKYCGLQVMGLWYLNRKILERRREYGKPLQGRDEKDEAAGEVPVLC